MTYENETCEGCITTRSFGKCPLVRKDEYELWCDAKKATPACDSFTPSLECRKVRALERLALEKP
jgi:hypothetical protein